MSPPPPPAERRATLLVCLLLVVLTLGLHHEVIFSGDVYHMDDAADGYYPCHVAITRAYAHGELPSWERGAATGWPMVADPYYGPFYPPNVLFGVLGAARGLGFLAALHTLLCGLGMLWLLRRRGLSPASAGFGAVSLALSSFLVCRIRHIIFPEGLAWMTFALCGVEGWLRTRRPRELVLVAASVGLTLLCGALPLLPFFGIVGVFYVLPRLRTGERPLVDALAIVGAALVGLLLSAAQLVPTLSHLPLSPRALGTSYAFASSYAWPSLSYLGTLLVPDLFGGEDREHWFGMFNHWEMAGYYVGVWAILLAPLAFWRRRRGVVLETIALLVAALMGIVLAFGDHAPLHGFFYKHLPLYAALRCPTRALVMTMLATTVLSAEGIEALLDRTRTRSVGWYAGAALFALGGVAFAIVLEKTKLFSHGALSPLDLVQRSAFAHLAVVLGAGLAALCLWLADGTRLVAPLFVLIAGVDLVTIDRGYVQPRPFDYVEGTQRLQAVDWLLQQKPTDRFALDPHGPFRLHNLGMTYGIEGVTAYSSVQIFRYVNFLQIIATGRGLPTPLDGDPAASDLKRFDSPLVDLLNVRWVLAERLPAPGWIERFHPKAGSTAPAAKWEPSWDRRISVWENPHVLPRAFVVHDVQVVTDEQAAQHALATLDPRKRVLVEHALLAGIVPAPLEPARVTKESRDRTVIESNAKTPGVLVVSQAFYPGWSATVDGQYAELLRADYALTGVVVPAGLHRVELRYASWPVRLGLIGTLLGLLGLFGLGLAVRR
ncbi:MAG: YfhO family protein [Polyangia bacterium]